MKILIVKLSSLGDVVHAMAAVQDLRQVFAQVQIDWVVERGFAALVRRCAGVNRVIECELRRWRQAPLAKPTRQAWRAFKTELQGERYDAVIDLQGLSKSALVAWLARLAPHGQRIGLANRTEGSSFEAPARWVADVAVTLPAHIHAVTRAREVCARALHYGVPAQHAFGLRVQADQAASALNQGVPAGHAPKGVVALVHGTSRLDKQWPVAAWQALGQRLNASGYGVALPHGSDQEQRVAQEIASTLADATVWPRLGLDVLSDALAACAGVVGVDSGLSHIAVALDLPHVQIYNFDTAWRTGPLPTYGVASALPAADGGPVDEAMPGARQRSVFAPPTPSVDAVWQAWLAVSNPVKSL